MYQKELCTQAMFSSQCFAGQVKTSNGTGAICYTVYSVYYTPTFSENLSLRIRNLDICEI